MFWEITTCYKTTCIFTTIHDTDLIVLFVCCLLLSVFNYCQYIYCFELLKIFVCYFFGSGLVVSIIFLKAREKRRILRRCQIVNDRTNVHTVKKYQFHRRNFTVIFHNWSEEMVFESTHISLLTKRTYASWQKFWLSYITREILVRVMHSKSYEFYLIGKRTENNILVPLVSIK
jgi:hypothetical protein